MVYIFGWLDRAGCKELSDVNIAAYFLRHFSMYQIL